jgi:hypothetical protein
MAITQKTILDDINNLVTKFKRTDEYRVPDLWLLGKINQVRAQLISEQYKNTEILDQNWYSTLGVVDFHTVNAADDASIGYCGCDTLSKAYIPQFVTLPTKSANQDLGIQAVVSTCGKKLYNNRPIAQWQLVPKEHPYSKMGWYWRINTAMYVNKVAKNLQLRISGILANPEEGFYINSAPIASGSIVSGTSYIVRGSQIVYNSVVYSDGDTFTGTATTTFGGSGKVYLANQLSEYIETYPYPVNADMARDIVVEICTKEYQIEKGQLADNTNDSKDDSQKSKA